MILPTVCHCHPWTKQFASRWLKMVHEKHLISTSDQVGTRAFHEIDSSTNPPFNSILPVTKENCLCLICCSSTVLVRFGFNNGKQFLTCRLHEKLSLHVTVQWKYVEHRTVCAVLYCMCSTVRYVQYCSTESVCTVFAVLWYRMRMSDGGTRVNLIPFGFMNWSNSSWAIWRWLCETAFSGRT